MRSHVVGGAAALLVVAGACGGPDQEGDPAQQGAVSVVATTTILGDIVERVVDCGDGEVTTLMPVGADPHDYAPSSAGVRDMVMADLVVANGLGLEEGLTTAIEAAREDGANVLEVAPLLDPIPLATGPAADEGSTDRGSDPHVWLDVKRMAKAATFVGNELADVTGDDAYATCGRQVAADIGDVDSQVRGTLERVPAQHRVLVTDHEAFAYFAQAYDFTVAAVVVPGGSTLADPSSEHLAELVGVIQDTGVQAIFGNVAEDSALLDALAEESGRDVEVVPLYVGSLGPDGSGAGTYPAMMLKNAELIADALTP